VLSPEKRVALALKVTTLMRERANALQLAQEGERRAHGFDYKSQQEDDLLDRDQTRQRNEMIDDLLAFMEKMSRNKSGHIATNENTAKIDDGLDPRAEGSTP
jgi:hypothetical protein